MPAGRRGSIRQRSLAGDGVYRTSTGVYTPRMPTGRRMLKDAARIAVVIMRFPPALSPAKTITSPVDPAKPQDKQSK